MPTDRIKSIRSSGGDYTTGTAWEAGEQANLVTLDERRIGEFYNDWPGGLSDSFSIAGWTTDATRYPILRAATGHKHTGVPQTGFYLKKAQNFGTILAMAQAYTELHDIDIENTGTSSATGINYTTSTTVTRRCIVKVAAGTAYNVQRAAELYNCLAYGSVTGFRNIAGYVRDLYHCVSANNTTGFFLNINSATTLKNCVSYNDTTDYTTTNTWGAASTNNATSAATTTNVPGANPLANIVAGDFLNAAGLDFHLSGTSSALYNNGAVTTLLTDIDGDTYGSPPSRGFDEFIAPPASSAGGIAGLSLGGIGRLGLR